jgi:hypothetical protein
MMVVPVLSKQRVVSRAGNAVVQVAAVAVGILVLIGVLALGTPPMQRAAIEARAPARSLAVAPDRAASPYERTVRRMTRINHLMEARQTELALAVRTGASRQSIAELRVEVASLERQYIAAIGAMSDAPAP